MERVIEKVTGACAGKPVSLEAGRMAFQASGAVSLQFGDTIVLATAVAGSTDTESDFVPLTVDYLEKIHAVGKIPGGFFKREGKPQEVETLTSRFIDRSIRPLLPKGWKKEIQVIASVMSADRDHDPDVMAITAASAALLISGIPIREPIAGIRVVQVEEKLYCNPSAEIIERSNMEIIIAGTRGAVVMVEGGSKEVSEEVILEAIELGHREIQGLIDLQLQLKERAGKPAIEFMPEKPEESLKAKVEEIIIDDLKKAFSIPTKQERNNAIELARQKAAEKLVPPEDAEGKILKAVNFIISDLEKNILREKVLKEKIRIDGRGYNDIRPITCEVGLLPRTHGSALFTRGETQAIVVTTLGTSEDRQRLDDLRGEGEKAFMLHYNFPPFSVGETKFLRGPGRREIGHGALAERSIETVLPAETDFPYTIRVVSEVLSSNGSSSMATVCGATLSLMDAGVPITSPVAGIAMGLVVEGQDFAVLSDILGDEDHLGDMDFKVAGTVRGVTAIQMDNKIGGVPKDVMRQALVQAKEGRIFILGKMAETISYPREDLSKYAPRIVTVQINPEKIKDVIGPGGKMVKKIIDTTGVKIDIDNSGRVNIASTMSEATKKAIAMIKEVSDEPEIGKFYWGTVKKIMDFGAFVSIVGNKDGLVHISQLAKSRVNKVEDVVKEGEKVLVKVLDIDRQGKIKLSRKEALDIDPEKVEELNQQGTSSQNQEQKHES